MSDIRKRRRAFAMLAKTAIIFVGVAAMADEIDAEIIKNLDFYQNLPVIEDMDMLELHAQTEPEVAAAAPRPGKESSNEKNTPRQD